MMEKKYKELLFCLIGSFVDSSLLLVLLISAGALAGLISVNVFTPSWNAPGLPLYYHYPKNIEFKALVLTLAAAPVLTVFFTCIRSRPFKLLISLAAFSSAFALVYNKYLQIDDAAGLLKSFASLFSLAGVLFYSMSRIDDVNALRRPVKPAVFIIFGAAATFYLFIENLYIIYIYDAGANLDLHHLGEVFASATDFLKGGRPFVTYFWPHGLQDTGAVALAFRLASRVDLPTMLLGDAASKSLSAASILLLGWGLGLRYYSVLIVSILILVSNALTISDATSLILLVLLSFAVYSKANKWHTFALAGSLAFLAHVCRINYGIYGFVSVAGLTAYQAASCFAARDYALLKDKLCSFLIYFAGASATASVMYGFLGWPGYDWYHVTLQILPKYFDDSAGLPFPFELKDVKIIYAARYNGPALPYVLATVILLASLSQYLWRSLKSPRSLNVFYVLVSLFSMVSLRTAFGRSDSAHVLQFAVFASVLILMLIVRRLVLSQSSVLLKVPITAGLFLFFNFWTLSFGITRLPPHSDIIKYSASVLSDYGNPSPPQCSQGMFSRINISSDKVAYYDGGICELKDALKKYDIGSGQLLVAHSAPLIYQSLRFKLPTKYYQIGWAITADMQKDLISELEASGVRAVLKVRTPEGIFAISDYDIPDSTRLPVYYGWFTERFDLDRPVHTRIGDLYLLRDIVR